MHASRPLGPRQPAPLSTSPPSLATKPLVVNKKRYPIPPPPTIIPPSEPLLDAPAPPHRSHTPKLTPLVISNPVGYGNGFSSSQTPGETTIRPPVSIDVPPDNTLPLMITKLNEGLKLEDEEHREPSFSAEWSDDVLEVISSLGEGAGGTVHKVKDKRTGKVLARKTITTRAAPMRQLERELSIIPIKHCNIVRFRGAYMSPSSSEVKIVMEYCEGGSLEAIGKRIKAKKAVVGERIAGRIAESVLQGLNYLHTMKRIHRDIKPPNILLTHSGVVKLCDFGVSGELVGSLAGTYTGTSLYMAPERIQGQEYSIRSDVWSAGITLLELVQNRFPFPNDGTVLDLIQHIRESKPPELEDEGDVQWSQEMKDFIKQALTHDAASRPYPRDMLKHPWIEKVMKQEVHMARWIREVWGWKKTKSKDE
ncbi:kinase-like protein [Dendrothele bispora CBS 962.96]|uniref:mitogen-activated protein kinase kinase n=1 Tax=Dendrothele bispora (strain CBS 962.96) TaxID=1314807 RepID=A0A4S8LWT2_DENBC|nr:kinase-like protein [Dendrothele bispora CBS 962.96]